MLLSTRRRVTAPLALAAVALMAAGCGSTAGSSSSVSSSSVAGATAASSAPTSAPVPASSASAGTASGGFPGPAGGSPGGAASSVTGATATQVAYADASPSENLTLYTPRTGSGPFPVVALFHGGGFAMGDAGMENQYAQDLVDAGFAVATVNYRLSGEATYPAGAQDAKAAIRWLRANASQYNLKADEIGAWGQSAGGYLANVLGATGDQATIFDDPALGNAGTSSAVQAVVSWFGPTDFATMDEQLACGADSQTHSDASSPESQWLGGAVASSSATPSTNVSAYVAKAKTLPAWFLAHGDADCLVPGGQSAELADAITAAGSTVDYTVLKGAGHMDPAFDSTQLAPTVDFLTKSLQGS
jgi:acetyl esterase/lipase